MVIATVILLLQLLFISSSFAKPVMRDLGTLGGSFSCASAINDNEQVAGYSYLADNTTMHPFIWENGKMNKKIFYTC